MAEKEAIVFVVDLGSSMGNCNGGRMQSDLDWSMQWVWDKITTIIAASRKTLNVGMLGLRTDGTKHPMSDMEGYENITLLQNLGPMTMGSLRKLQESVKTSDTDSGDAISAIVIAIEMINEFTKKLKYKRQIFLVTDGLGAIDGDEIDEIVSKINESNIELTVL
jgi:ATP-dependent DNA helicase 2 subunit 2